MIIHRVKLNYKLLWFMGIVGTNLLVVTTYIGFKIIPQKIQDKIWEQKLPVNGTEAWNTTFIKQPSPSKFKVFLFNVANPEEVLEGAKPVVREMGPYVYSLNRWKEGLITENDTISYYEYEMYKFDEEASGQCKENDDVTILNLPMLSLLYTVETTPFASYLDTISTSLDLIFGEHRDLFTNVKVKDFLFEGLKLCQKEFGSGIIQNMICTQIREKLDGTKQMWEEDGGIKFAALRYRNNTHQGYMTVKSGETNRIEFGTLIKLNNEPNISTWLDLNNNQCNKIGGVTSVFPVDINKEMNFEVFSEDICRALSLVFKKTEYYNGLPAYRFTTDSDTFSYDGNRTQCYCTNKSLNIDGTKGCMFNGVLDGTSCTVSIMPFRVSITIIITTFWWCAAMAKIYQRCELARELKKLAVPPQEIPTWVCIAQHESLFDTSAMNLGSGDHGLFQISEIYWCSPSGYGCHKPCTAFRDDDIADDIECVRRIYNEHTQISGDGWNAWVVYPLYCKGDVVHYIQNCDLESVNVTLNEIPNEGSTEKFVDEFGDGYQFPPLPSYNRKSQNTHRNDISGLKGDYGDGYQFPPLPTIKNDNFKSTFNNFKEDFEKYKDEYEFPQSEIELPQRVDNFGDGYQFPPFPTFDNLPEVLDNRVKIKPLEKTTENVGYVSFQKIIENRLKNSQPEETKTKTVESSTKLIKVQKFSSKTTRQVEATTTTILDNRFSHLGETTTKKDAVSSTQAPFTFKMFSLTPFILNGEAVSINGEKVTIKAKLTKLDTSDISLSESIKSYTATSKNSKPHVQSSTTLKTTTPELISIKTSTNAPVALALQSLSQTKSETSTKRVRTFKPKTKSTKLYSSKYRTTKAPSTTEKSFIINTISAFVPKSDKKTSATTSSIKAITFKPLTTTTVSTLTKIIDIPSTEQPSSSLKLPISTFKPLSVFSSNIFSLNSSAIHKPIFFPSSNAINGSLDLFANAPSKPFSFSTYAPFADSLNSSLRQVTFPSYFPSWFQTLPPALPPLPPLPNMRPSSGKPSRPFATRPTRRTTTSRPIRPLRPLFSQVTYKPSESSTETQFKLINSESPIPKINSFNAGNTIESSYFKNENSSPLPLSKFEKLSKFPSFEGNTGEVHTQPITRDYFSDIFDIESKISPDEELEEIILEPDYSFYRTKNGYRLFRRSPKRKS